MPTILITRGFRFYFYSGDHVEPAHIHATKDGCVAKFWLDPVRLASGGRFRPAQLIEIQRMVDDNKDLFIRSWHEYFHD